VHYYTLGQAARATGVSKTTISKAIARGKISVFEKSKEGFKIEQSELHRVFPLVTETTGQKVTIDNTKEIGVTASQETEIRLLREMLKREQEQNHFLQEQLTRSTLLLEAIRQPEQQKQGGFFARLFQKL
jgi:excisionase family DNA binding protein